MFTTDTLATALADRYTIERLIGEGGMARVFLARDLRHNRRVALKVLRPDLGAVVGVERFQAEIEVTANLQHPNLLPLFDSGEAGDLLFYVMPYVEGESLRARIDREKQLPVDEAVRLASAIAGALDYAHRHGVIHRDLKPENILLHEGQPLVADFGIALAISKASGARITQTGISLGTPQYMSPEQATGDRAIDGRTDIYSLGALTYEMLTGEPPHAGSTSQAVIARVLTERPRGIRATRPSVPTHVEAAVDQSLEKLPADRFATAGDFALALTGARPVVPVVPTGAAAETNPRTRVLVASLAVMTLIAAGATASTAWLATRPVPRLSVARFRLGLPDSVELFTGGGPKLALSRDGSKIVFVGVKNGQRALYVRRIDDPVAQLVRGSETPFSGSNVAPTFSPQGDWLAFEADRVPKKIPVSGGIAKTLADSGGSISWGDNGVLLFVRGRGIWRGTSEGRDAHLLAAPDTAHGIFGLSWPEVLPGGTHSLVTINRAREARFGVDSMRLGIIDLKSGAVTDLGVPGTDAHYVSSGHILFGRAGNLVFVAPFSLQKRAVTGPETLLLENVWQGSGGATGFSVSDNGTLAYNEETQITNKELVAVNRTGAARRLSGAAKHFENPRLSPDGRTIASDVVDRDGRREIALIDVSTGAYQRLVAPDSGRAPEWTRDSGRIVFTRRMGDSDEIVSRARDRSSGDVVLGRVKSSGPMPLRLTVGVPHGLAAVTRDPGPGRYDVYLTPIDSIGVLRPFAEGSARNSAPSISSDGRLIAWVSDESGSNQIYVQPMSGGARVQVSVNGGLEPLWSRTGTTLFYRSARSVTSADISGSPLRVTRRDSLFADLFVGVGQKVGQNWDVFPNGKEFLMVRPLESEATGAFVVLNWPQLKVSPSAAARP